MDTTGKQYKIISLSLLCLLSANVVELEAAGRNRNNRPIPNQGRSNSNRSKAVRQPAIPRRPSQPPVERKPPVKKETPRAQKPPAEPEPPMMTEPTVMTEPAEGTGEEDTARRKRENNRPNTSGNMKRPAVEIFRADDTEYKEPIPAPENTRIITDESGETVLRVEFKEQTYRVSLGNQADGASGNNERNETEQLKPPMGPPPPAPPFGSPKPKVPDPEVEKACQKLKEILAVRLANRENLDEKEKETIAGEIAGDLKPFILGEKAEYTQPQWLPPESTAYLKREEVLGKLDLILNAIRAEVRENKLPKDIAQQILEEMKKFFLSVTADNSAHAKIENFIRSINVNQPNRGPTSAKPNLSYNAAAHGDSLELIRGGNFKLRKTIRSMDDLKQEDVQARIAELRKQAEANPDDIGGLVESVKGMFSLGTKDVEVTESIVDALTIQILDNPSQIGNLKEAILKRLNLDQNNRQIQNDDFSQHIKRRRDGVKGDVRPEELAGWKRQDPSEMVGDSLVNATGPQGGADNGDGDEDEEESDWV